MDAPESRLCEYIRDRLHFGQLQNPTSVGRSSLDGQPPVTTMWLRIENGVVHDGRFQTTGCGYLIASCAASIELSLGRPVEACLGIKSQDIELHLGSLPINRQFAAELAVEALRDALNNNLRGN